jgi:hypothetical protein
MTRIITYPRNHSTHGTYLKRLVPLVPRLKSTPTPQRYRAPSAVLADPRYLFHIKLMLAEAVQTKAKVTPSMSI